MISPFSPFFGFPFGTAPLSRSSDGMTSLDNGLDVGHAFDMRGHDFLDPDDVQDHVDGVSSSIRPIRSNTPQSQLIGEDPFGSNPDADRILRNTTGLLRAIQAPNFGSNLRYDVPLLEGPFAVPVPDLGNNPDSTTILLDILFFQKALGVGGHNTNTQRGRAPSTTLAQGFTGNPFQLSGAYFPQSYGNYGNAWQWLGGWNSEYDNDHCFGYSAMPMHNAYYQCATPCRVQNYLY